MKNKRKIIFLVSILILAICVLVFVYLKQKPKENVSRDFLDYINVDDITNIDISLSNERNVIKTLGEEFDSKVDKIKFYDYQGKIIFYREENKIKRNSFQTILGSKDDKIEDIQKYTDQFIEKCIESVENYTEIISTMLVINEDISEIDTYSDILSGRAIYRTFLDVNEEHYFIDVYLDGNSIIGQFSYDIKIDNEEIPENGVG